MLEWRRIVCSFKFTPPNRRRVESTSHTGAPSSKKRERPEGNPLQGALAQISPESKRSCANGRQARRGEVKSLLRGAIVRGHHHLVQVASSPTLPKRRFLRWILIIMFGVPALLLAVFIVTFVTGMYRLEHELGFWVRVNLPAAFAGCTDLRFGESGAPPTRAEGAIYVVNLPPDGRWHSSTQLSWGETLSFAYYYPTQEGWQRVKPNRQRGSTTTYHDGSVDPGWACFEQPLKWATGKGPGPLP